ncbi:MAG: ABC transporter substrate-binding protein [Natronospirillum sp.]
MALCSSRTLPRIGIHVACLLCCFGLLVSASGARELIIVGTAEAPLKMQQGNIYSGIDVDIVAEAMRRMGVESRFILVESGTRMLQMLLQGNADMGLALSRNEEREGLAYYPDEAYLELSWNLFIHRDNVGHIQFDSYVDLHDLRIGATQGYAYTEEFWNAGLNLDVVSQNDLHLGKLRAKRIDAVPLNTIVTRYELARTGLNQYITFLRPPLRSTPYYNVFSRASDYPDLSALIEEYSQTIAKMKDDGTIESIMTKYLN